MQAVAIIAAPVPPSAVLLAPSPQQLAAASAGALSLSNCVPVQESSLELLAVTSAGAPSLSNCVPVLESSLEPLASRLGMSAFWSAPFTYFTSKSNSESIKFHLIACPVSANASWLTMVTSGW